MTDDLDDPLAALSAALDVDPSPEFAARVRGRIEQHSHARRRWSLVVAAGAVAAVMVAVWLRMEPLVNREPQVTAVAEPAPAVVPVPAPPRDAPAQVEVRRVVQRDRARQLSARHEPEILIAPDEAIAFQRLVRALYEGRIVAADPVLVPTLQVGIEVRSLPFGEIAPIVVEPVVIGPLAPDAIADREG